MTHARFVGIAFALFASHAGAQDPKPLSDYVAVKRPDAPQQVSYGAAPSQGIDVFVPAGNGPHPTAILVHGGCWRARPGLGREQLRHLGAELASRGVAVWSIGYRRATEDGGGYPGTYQDVGAALDRIRAEAPRFNLDLTRTVMVGHSAGGHLALWAAARASLPTASPLYAADPFVPRTTVSVAGPGDMRGFGKFVPVICEPGIIEKLTAAPLGSADAKWPEISPADMGAPGGSIVVVNGVLDPIVPPFAAFDYARAMRAKKPSGVDLVLVPGTGHFDFFIPGAAAWTTLNQRIDKELGIVR